MLQKQEMRVGNQAQPASHSHAVFHVQNTNRDQQFQDKAPTCSCCGYHGYSLFIVVGAPCKWLPKRIALHGQHNYSKNRQPGE